MASNLLFLGKLDFRPNAEGLRWFIERVLPRVAEAMPQVRLFAVGDAPPAWLVQAGQHDPRIAVTGYVADERAYLQRCSVLLLPLHAGGGSRLKALVAMASGLPIVSTSLGMEGLDVEPGAHFLRADSGRRLGRLGVSIATRAALARRHCAACSDSCRAALRLACRRSRARSGVRGARRLSAPMQAPRGGWLASWRLLAAASCGSRLHERNRRRLADDRLAASLGGVDGTRSRDVRESACERDQRRRDERVSRAGGRARETPAQPRAAPAGGRHVDSAASALGADRAGGQGRVRRSELRRLDLGQVRRHRRALQQPGSAADPAAGHESALGAARRRRRRTRAAGQFRRLLGLRAAGGRAVSRASRRVSDLERAQPDQRMGPPATRCRRLRAPAARRGRAHTSRRPERAGDDGGDGADADRERGRAERADLLAARLRCGRDRHVRHPRRPGLRPAGRSG